jgi:hypothetical protein
MIAAAFQDIFLSVMTPKNRRAEVSFNLVDFLFFKHPHHHEEIYLSLLAFNGRECIWTTRKATKSVSIVEGRLWFTAFSYHWLRILVLGLVSRIVTEATLLLMHQMIFPSVSNHDLVIHLWDWKIVAMVKHDTERSTYYFVLFSVPLRFCPMESIHSSRDFQLLYSIFFVESSQGKFPLLISLYYHT